MNLKTRHRILFVFLLYFLFSICFPYSHCHASNTLTEDVTCKKGHAARHHLIFSNDQCCELHGEDPSGSHNHHVHFLIEQQAVFAKSRHNIKSVTPLQWLALPEIMHLVSSPLSCESLLYGISNAFQQEYFTSFSGLSPPQV